MLLTIQDPHSILKRRHFGHKLSGIPATCFGGADLRQLYIVTGSDGAEGDRVGSVFVEPVDVAGLPVAVARVQLPAAPDG